MVQDASFNRYSQQISGSISSDSQLNLSSQDFTRRIVFNEYVQPSQLEREFPLIVKEMTIAVAQVEQLNIDQLRMLRANFDLLRRMTSAWSSQSSVTMDYTANIADLDCWIALKDAPGFFRELEQIQVPDGYFILQDGRRLPIYSEHLKHLGAFEGVLEIVDSSEIREGIPYPLFDRYLSPDEAEKFMVATYTGNCAGLWNEESVGRWLAAADILASPKIKREAAQWILKHLSAQSVESFYRQAKEINHPTVINLVWCCAEKRGLLTEEMLNDPHWAAKVDGNSQRFLDRELPPLRRNSELLRIARESEEKGELKPQHCWVNIGGKQLVMDKMICLSFPPLAEQLRKNQLPLTLSSLQSEDLENLRELLYTGHTSFLSSDSASRLKSLFEPYVHRSEMAQIFCSLLRTDDEICSLIPLQIPATRGEKFTALLDIVMDTTPDDTNKEKIINYLGKMGDFIGDVGMDSLMALLKDPNEKNLKLRFDVARVLSQIGPDIGVKRIDTLITLLALAKSSSGREGWSSAFAAQVLAEVADKVKDTEQRRIAEVSIEVLHDLVRRDIRAAINGLSGEAIVQNFAWIDVTCEANLITLKKIGGGGELQSFIVRALVDLLQEPSLDPAMRSMISETLVNIGNRTEEGELHALIWQTFVAVIRDRSVDASLREKIAQGLAIVKFSIEQEESQAFISQELINVLQDPNESFTLRNYAASALGQIGHAIGRETVASLVGIVQDDSMNIGLRKKAMEALGNIGAMIKERDLQTLISQTLTAALQIPDTVNYNDDLCIHAANGLYTMRSAIGEVEAEVLMRVMQNTTSSTRFSAVAKTLSSIGPAIGKRRIDTLIDGLRDSGNLNWRRQAAAESLGRIGPAIGREGIAVLIAVVEDPNADLQLRRVAALALCNMEHEIGEEGKKALVTLLRHPGLDRYTDSNEFKDLLYRIGSVLGESGVETLIAMLQDPHRQWHICEMVIETLCRIRPSIKKEEIQQIVASAKKHHVGSNASNIQKVLQKNLCPETVPFQSLFR